MENEVTETTPWSDCPLDIFSLGETKWAFNVCQVLFQKAFY
jgi:hypothetical protein